MSIRNCSKGIIIYYFRNSCTVWNIGSPQYMNNIYGFYIQLFLFVCLESQAQSLFPQEGESGTKFIAMEPNWDADKADLDIRKFSFCQWV